MNPGADFDSDAGERLMWQLRDLPFHKQLEPAVKLAGRQFGYLKPSLMAMTAGVAVTGPVAEVTRGTIVIVPANREKLVIIRIPDQPRRSELLSAASANGTRDRHRSRSTHSSRTGVALRASESPVSHSVALA